MTRTGEIDSDPGPDYCTRLNPERAKRRALDQLRAMGYEVTLNPPLNSPQAAVVA